MNQQYKHGSNLSPWREKTCGAWLVHLNSSPIKLVIFSGILKRTDFFQLEILVYRCYGLWQWPHAQNVLWVTKDNPFKRARTLRHLRVAEKTALSVTKLLCLFPFQQVSEHFWSLLSGLHITFSVNSNGILQKLPACGSKDYCCFHLKQPKALLS